MSRPKGRNSLLLTKAVFSSLLLCHFVGGFADRRITRVRTNRYDSSTVSLVASAPFLFDLPIIPSGALLEDPRAFSFTIGIPAVLFFLSSILPKSQLINEGTLRLIAEDTFLQGKELERVYKASKDGWSALDFHNAVDGRGSSIVVAQQSFGGAIFGGFNPQGWRSTDDYYSSSSAFLWSTIGTGSVSKYKVLVGGDAAIFDYATGGPCFGSADLLIGPPQAAVMGGFTGPDMENMSANAGDLRLAKSSAGTTYNVDRRWPARGRIRLADVEVYCCKKAS